MHSKWGIIAVLAALAAALLVTMSISGCPSAPEQEVIDDVPPPDMAPPVPDAEAPAPDAEAPVNVPVGDAPPVDPAMETPPPAPPVGE